MERRKYLAHHRDYANSYFWRLYNGQEIDYLEEKDGKLVGYEYKWKKSEVRPPKDWLVSYPESTFTVIHQENYLSFMT